MNTVHLELCSSERWAVHLQTDVIPWALGGVDLGGRLLEIGPGFGAATELLRHHVEQLVGVEQDPRLAASLAERFGGDPVVTIHEGDATRLAFPDDSFDGAACFTMLHHVPSARLQDRLFGEVARVVRPRGVFLGVDSLGGRRFEEFHHDDVCVVVDPLTLADRLRAAGFEHIDVGVLSIGVRFRAAVRQP